MAEGMFGYTPSVNVAPNMGSAISASKQADTFDMMANIMEQGVKLYDKTVGEENRLQSNIKAIQESNDFTANLNALGDVSYTDKANRVDMKLVELNERKARGEINDSYYKAYASHILETQASFNKAAKVEIKHNTAKAIMDLGLAADEYVPATNDNGDTIDGLSTGLRTFLQKTAKQGTRLDILSNPRYTIQAEANLVALKEEMNKLSDADKEIANGYFTSITTKYSDRIKDITTGLELTKSSVLNTLSDSHNSHAINDARKTASIFLEEVKDYPEGDIKNRMMASYLDMDRSINNELERRDREAERRKKEAEALARAKDNVSVDKQKALQANNLLVTSIMKGDVVSLFNLSMSPEYNNYVKGKLNIMNDDNVVSQLDGKTQAAVVSLGTAMLSQGNTTSITNLFGSVSNFYKMKNALDLIPKDDKTGIPKTSLTSYMRQQQQKGEFSKVDIDPKEYSDKTWSNKVEMKEAYKELRQTYPAKEAAERVDKLNEKSFHSFSYFGMSDNKNDSYKIRNGAGVFTNEKGVAEILHTWRTGKAQDGIPEGFLPKNSIVELEGGVIHIRNKDGTPVWITTKKGIEPFVVTVNNMEQWSNSTTINQRIKTKEVGLLNKYNELNAQKKDKLLGTTTSKKAKEDKAIMETWATLGR